MVMVTVTEPISTFPRDRFYFQLWTLSVGLGNNHANIMGREYRDKLETARMTLDWLEYGEMYAYPRSTTINSSGSAARVARARVGMRSGSVDAPDLGLGPGNHRTYQYNPIIQGRYETFQPIGSEISVLGQSSVY